MTTSQPSDPTPGPAEVAGNKTPVSRCSPWIGLFLFALVFPVFVGVVWLYPPVFDEWLGLVPVSLAFSFSSLLGIWVNLGRGSLRRRLVWAVAGVLYCLAMMVFTIFLGDIGRGFLSNELVEFMLVVFFTLSLPAVGNGFSLGIAQWLGVRLAPPEEVSLQQDRKSFQFSLRSLMGVIVAIAILLALCQSSRVYNLSEKFEILFVAALGFLAVLVTLAAVWAALGLGRPLLRIVAVILAALCLGLAVQPFAKNSRFYELPAFAVIQVVGIFLPLLIVRRYGYRLVRLVRLPSDDQVKKSDGEPSCIGLTPGETPGD